AVGMTALPLKRQMRMTGPGAPVILIVLEGVVNRPGVAVLGQLPFRLLQLLTVDWSRDVVLWCRLDGLPTQQPHQNRHRSRNTDQRSHWSTPIPFVILLLSRRPMTSGNGVLPSTIAPCRPSSNSERAASALAVSLAWIISTGRPAGNTSPGAVSSSIPTA